MCLSLNLSSQYLRTRDVFPTQPSPSNTTLKFFVRVAIINQMQNINCLTITMLVSNLLLYLHYKYLDNALPYFTSCNNKNQIFTVFAKSNQSEPIVQKQQHWISFLSNNNTNLLSIDQGFIFEKDRKLKYRFCKTAQNTKKRRRFINIGYVGCRHGMPDLFVAEKFSIVGAEMTNILLAWH